MIVIPEAIIVALQYKAQVQHLHLTLRYLSFQKEIKEYEVFSDSNIAGKILSKFKKGSQRWNPAASKG
jgi:hypothetical protein